MYKKLPELVASVKEEISKGIDLAIRRYETDNRYLYRPEYKDSVSQQIESMGRDIYAEKAVFTHVNRLFALFQMEEKGIIERYLSDEMVGADDIIEGYKEACREAADVLNGVFERRTMHAELIPDRSYLYRAVEYLRKWKKDTVSEGNLWLKDDLLGWVYQEYASDREREVRAKQQKIGNVSEPFEVRAITQFYTDDYMVEYIVEKTLGRAEKDFNFEEIKVLDPAVGSGHFLIKVFDWFVKRYEEAGVRPEETVRNILAKHLYGLDIDERAVQIAGLVLLIKGAEYLLKHDIHPTKSKLPRPHVAAPVEGFFEDFKLNKVVGEGILPLEVAVKIEDAIQNLSLYGSLVNPYEIIARYTRGRLKGSEKEFIELLKEDIEDYLKRKGIEGNLREEIFGYQWEFIQMLFDNFHVVVANPPYLNVQNISGRLKEFIGEYYPEAKDLYQVFILRAIQFAGKYKGYVGMVNGAMWTFLKTMSKFREAVFERAYPVEIVDLGEHAFKNVTGFVFAINILHASIPIDEEKIEFLRLRDLSREEKEDVIRTILAKPETLYTKYKDRVYIRKIKAFKRLTKHLERYGLKMPLIYVLNEEIISLWDRYPTLGEVADIPRGLTTGKDKEFIRYHWEVRREDINFNYPKKKDYPRWVPLSKGGGAQKWYGGLWWVIDWENNGARVKAFKKSTVVGEEFYGREGVFWAYISREKLIRYLSKGMIFAHVTVPVFLKNEGFPFISMFLLASETVRIILFFVEPLHKNDIWAAKSLPFPTEIPKRESQIGSALSKIAVALKKKRLSVFPIEFHFEGSPLSQYGSPQRHRKVADAMDVYLHLIDAVVDKVAQRVYGISDDTLQYIYRHMGLPVAYLPVLWGDDIERFFREHPLKELLPEKYRKEFGIADEDIERAMQEIRAFLKNVDMVRDISYEEEKVREAYSNTCDSAKYYYGSGIEGISREIGINPISAYYLVRRVGIPEEVEDFDMKLALDEAVVDILMHDDLGILPYDDLMSRVAEWFEERGISYNRPKVARWLKDPKGYAAFHKKLHNPTGQKAAPIVFFISEKGFARGRYAPRAVAYGVHHKASGAWVDVMKRLLKEALNTAMEEMDKKAIQALGKAQEEIEHLRAKLDTCHPDNGSVYTMDALGKFVWKK